MPRLRTRRRPLSAAFFFLVVSFLMVSCGPPSDAEAERQAEERAEKLFAALASGDMEALRSMGPAFEDIEDSVAQSLRDRLVENFEWSVGDAEVFGRIARVPVTLTPLSGGEREVVVPMRWRSGSWQVEPSIRVTEHIDIVPLED